MILAVPFQLGLFYSIILWFYGGGSQRTPHQRLLGSCSPWRISSCWGPGLPGRGTVKMSSVVLKFEHLKRSKCVSAVYRQGKKRKKNKKRED